MTGKLVKDDRYPYLDSPSDSNSNSKNDELKLHYQGSDSNQTDDLPLVLCGPILRRVSWDSVTVWIALRKEPNSIELEIFEGIGSQRPKNLKSMDQNEPLKVGKNLHVCAVTQTGIHLDRGKVYTYDLNIHFDDDSKHLDDPGVLRADQGGYEPIHVKKKDKRPSFVYPPLDPDNLRLFYGSCRKPHGKGKGTMRAVTEALANENDYDLTKPKERPHLLLLGGDQIYGDDVADQLFAMIWNYSDVLLGVEETIHDPGDPRDDSASTGSTGLEDFRPDHRQKPSIDRAKLSATDGYGTSHLYGFGEYMTMYLCVWSDVLWPPADELETALPSKFQLCHVPKEDGPKLDIMLPDHWDEIKDEKKKYRKKVSKVSPAPSLFEDRFPEKHHKHEENTQRLKEFREDLPAIRRALANVPTYMIWDDHDVTDDWFVNGDWVADVLGNKMGHQIVRNGMAAAIVCQMWGNTYEQYTNNGNRRKPVKFLKELKGLPERDTSTLQWFHERLGIPTRVNAAEENVKIPEHRDAWNRMKPLKRFKYHFGLGYGKYGIGVLDTRTWRGFPDLDKEGAAEIISIEGQSEQLEDIESDITYQLDHNPGLNRKFQSFPPKWPLIVQNPVPLWPIQEANLGQEFKYEKERVSDELPYVQGNDGIAASEYADYEHWRMRRGAMETLVSSLASKSNYVVTLSGDVHHGFTSRTEYWHPPKGPVESTTTARLANLTSSATKNEDHMTRFIHKPGYVLDSAVGVGGWYYPDPDVRETQNTSIPVVILNGTKEMVLPNALHKAITEMILDEHSTTLSKGTQPHYLTTKYLIKGRGIDTDGLVHEAMIRFQNNQPNDSKNSKGKNQDEQIELYTSGIPIVAPSGPITKGQLDKKYDPEKVDVNIMRGDLIVDPEWNKWLLPKELKKEYDNEDLAKRKWWNNYQRPVWREALPDKWAPDSDESWEPTLRKLADVLGGVLQLYSSVAANFVRTYQTRMDPDWEYRVDYLEGTEPADSKRTERPGSDEKQGKELQSWKDYKNHDYGKEVVGRSNFGEVRFDWSGSDKKVKHWLWWRMNGTAEVYPWTEWSVNMNPQREKPSKIVKNTLDPW